MGFGIWNFGTWNYEFGFGNFEFGLRTLGIGICNLKFEMFGFWILEFGCLEITHKTHNLKKKTKKLG